MWPGIPLNALKVRPGRALLSMIYERPKFYPGGDRIVEMELGDEMSFDLNFLVHRLVARIRAAEQ